MTGLRKIALPDVLVTVETNYWFVMRLFGADEAERPSSRNGNVFAALGRQSAALRALCEQAPPRYIERYVTSARIFNICMCGVAVATFRVFALEKYSMQL